MIGLARLSPRQWMIVAHDAITPAVALAATFVIRFEDNHLLDRLSALVPYLPLFVLYAVGVFFALRLHESKWRFSSIADLRRIASASAVLALSLLVVDYILVSPNVYGAFFFGKVTIALYFVLQAALLATSRVLYRYFREIRTQRGVRVADAAPTLILGRAADVEVLLRAIESGAVRTLWPVGILSPSRADRAVRVRGVPVLGDIADLTDVVALHRARKTGIVRIILTPSAVGPDRDVGNILTTARKLGLSVSRLPSLDEGDEVRLQPVAVEDLLLRDSVRIDNRGLEAAVKGRSIAVTGGGGSIGAELCRRLALFGAGRILVLENSEPALYAILEELGADASDGRVEGRIADVRDRERIGAVLDAFKPDLVFHAAALKHVPILERDWPEAIKTNVFGSINVADAAAAAGASAMVMISTDKAIEPVSMLGATKRLAEIYCQALDEQAQGSGAAGAMRWIAVRFGNVLASNGSVVPKFKAQIEAGGPVTVTDPEMVRYFMTIREACDLVLTSAAHALKDAQASVSVYVLNMGQPVKILTLAERMIRLMGLEPGHDIPIVFTGARPGERLHEILFAQHETSRDIGVAGVVAAAPSHPTLARVRTLLAGLEEAVRRGDRAAVDVALAQAVPDFAGEAGTVRRQAG